MLTNRLQTIANLIKPQEKIADIGTDHAYIPIYLVREHICHHALCSDIHKGPYEIAKENVKAYGFSDQIEVRLGGGLKPYTPGEFETATIAGMGGEMIVKILQEDIAVAKSVSRFLLQPMTALDEIRLYLYQNGYNIKAEHLALEGKKYYVIFDVVWGKTPMPYLEYLYIGKGLLEENSPYLSGYLSHLKRCWSTAVEGMKQANGIEQNLEKYEYLLSKVSEFQKNL